MIIARSLAVADTILFRLLADIPVPSFFPLLGMRVCRSVMPFLYAAMYHRRFHPSVMVEIMPVRIPVLMIMTVMTIIVIVQIAVIAIIIMPVKRVPGCPVGWIIAVMPWRMPYHISRKEDITDQRPCIYLNISVRLNYSMLSSCISRIGRLLGIRIVGLNDVVFPIQILITDALNMQLVLAVTKYIDDSYVLYLGSSNRYLQHYIMYITIYNIRYIDVINMVVTVKVQIIDILALIIKTPLKAFKCFRFLKQFHDGKEIQVVTRETQVLLFLCCRKIACGKNK
jgi:hypothetical protein